MAAISGIFSRLGRGDDIKLTDEFSPGRFFASNLLKLLLAHIALEYDIEPIGVRPENPWLNNSIGPPIWSKLRIRRRDQASHVTFFGPVSSFGGDAEAKC